LGRSAGDTQGLIHAPMLSQPREGSNASAQHGATVERVKPASLRTIDPSINRPFAGVFAWSRN
jgi:hypothetical protein